MPSSDSRTERTDAAPTPRALTPVAADSVLGRAVALLVFTRRKPLALVRAHRPGTLTLGLVCLVLTWVAVMWLHARPGGPGLLLGHVTGHRLGFGLLHRDGLHLVEGIGRCRAEVTRTVLRGDLFGAPSGRLLAQSIAT